MRHGRLGIGLLKRLIINDFQKALQRQHTVVPDGTSQIYSLALSVNKTLLVDFSGRLPSCHRTQLASRYRSTPSRHTHSPSACPKLEHRRHLVRVGVFMDVRFEAAFGLTSELAIVEFPVLGQLYSPMRWRSTIVEHINMGIVEARW